MGNKLKELSICYKKENSNTDIYEKKNSTNGQGKRKAKVKKCSNKSLSNKDDEIITESKMTVSVSKELQVDAVVLKKISKSEEIFNNLVKNIVDLKIEPGEKLSENQLSSEYSVSRTIVRSALLKLSEIHFVEIKPKSGTFVTKINMDYIRAALIVRLSLEKESCVRLIEDDTKRNTLVKKLNEIYKEQLNYKDRAEYIKSFAKLDTEFHNCILDVFEESKMTDVIKVHLLHIARWRNYVVDKIIGIEQILKEHKEIISAMEKRDKKRLMNILNVHINKTIFDMGENHKEFWNYFK